MSVGTFNVHSKGESDISLVWVLTLPSFQWLNVYTGNSPRYSMTCHPVGGRQMIVVGGSASSHVNATCDSVKQGLVILDMTDIAWGTDYDASPAPYQVPSQVIAMIGGT
jgi:hypothetical protein